MFEKSTARTFLLLAFLMAARNSTAALVWSPNGPFGGPHGVGHLMTQTVPAYPMREGQWTVAVVGATFANTNEGGTSQPTDKRDLKGFGGAVTATYAFSLHYGVGVTAARVSADGISGLVSDCSSSPPCGGTVRFGEGEISASAGSAFLILDPFKDPEGFRLPVMIGFGLFGIDETATISSAGETMSAQRRFNGTSLSFGISPQFNVTRWLRAAPFFFRIGRSDPEETCTGATCGPPQDIINQPVESAGIQLTFKPWNLGLLYVIPQGCDGSGSACTKVSTFAIRWQKTFGAAATEATAPAATTGETK